ncbi:MAG: cytosolic protein [Chlorobium sp.]|uniref:PmeII family type II restriction endonuclease n=1 Tax=Chlorobium sp. TaxID=1095 RepID=UPI0025BD7885|nr:PmeII family type II restriction endonuclease [Chlorobium sp.]MCF8216519.1 cytosolic protein [Chlorobium sp.]MCF8271424.1 cytosolic protein [Chlorobium sp.]MCF8287796.1 cytosolic protein [Chlorobium sp.]MCF8291335.1 cytosolic protein [Chlorobium sp.]MCF8385430.1 cytosolic protein [Chlorobium sp.]
MQQISLNDVSTYVENNIGTFHQKRIASLDGLSLTKVLKRKNPYLFKAKYVLTAEEIIRGLIDAHISSNEETIFGDWLEGLAIFINGKVYGGWKSGIEGIDLEFDNNGQRFMVNIKSGPNWGNASQIKKMKSDFRTAAKTLRTSNSGLQVVAINGCCYGKSTNPDKGDYFKYCGQRFWEFISGNAELYTEIIEPLGHKAKEKNDDFQQSYAQRINMFTKAFTSEYCKDNGAIDWKKIVEFNSSAR